MILTLEEMLAEELREQEGSVRNPGKTGNAAAPEHGTEDEPAGSLPVFDLHCDTADRLSWQTLPRELKEATGLEYYGPDDERYPDGARELARNRCHISLEKIGSTPWVQCFATFVPDELTPEQSLGFWRHVDGYLHAQASENEGSIHIADRSDDLRGALTGHALVAVPTIENARMLALDPKLAYDLADAGVRIASISWNAAGPLASGHDTLEGLTRAGRAAVVELQRAGITLDVSHLNDACFTELAKIAKGPIIATHSNSRTVCPAPRNLTDTQFCEIRDRGGLIGINFCRDFLSESNAGIDDIARHIEHFLDLGGEDVLALGSDFDGCDVPDCVADASRIPDFQRQLIHFFGRDITRKICAENALLFFDRR